jgi:hypothetical protein
MVGYYGKGAAINVGTELIYGVNYCKTFEFGDTVIGFDGVKCAGGIRYSFTGLFLSSLFNLHEDWAKSRLARIRMDFEG